MSQITRKLCAICTEVLSRGFRPSDDSLPFHLSTVSDNIARPNLDIVHQAAKDGCPICAEMIRVHWTKICNSFDGTTKEEDAEEALEAVALKFPRISMNMVFQDEDEEGPASYLLVFTHELNENEENDEGEGGATAGLGRFGFGTFGGTSAELDTEAYLQTMIKLIKTDCKFYSIV